MLSLNAQIDDTPVSHAQIQISEGLFTVTNTGDSGPGSLRQAILDSNASTGGLNTIEFAIPGSGVQTILPTSALPPVTGSVLIDGFSQPGFAGAPLIQISGYDLYYADTLTISGSEVTVRGLDFSANTYAAAIRITGATATHNWIYGNFVGIAANGPYPEPNNTGVLIDSGASENLIGTNGDGVDDLVEQNVISSNNVNIHINGYDSFGSPESVSGNIVAGNLIGTDSTGSYPIGSGNDIVVDNGTSNWIGVNPLGGAVAADEGNLIVGAYYYYSFGVSINGGGGNVVAGNRIGFVSAGGVSNQYGAAVLIGDSPNNTIGGDSAAAGNLITGNNGAGIDVFGSDSMGNQFTANRIFGNGGQAIDLDDDGVTGNGTAPRQGANNLQNFPIVGVSADGQARGWLAGSAPDTSFLIDIFASALYGLGGAGEADDYLGSLEVTTDSQGQVLFDVPFPLPEDLPVLTATATDPQGNTSEVSALRQGAFQIPAQTPRFSSGQPLVLSAASGGGVVLDDAEAGPLDLTWLLSLSVESGTLTLSTTDGLIGSGDGTGSLSYQGPLSAINAALDGMQFTPLAGIDGNQFIELDAQASGATSISSQLLISNGVFSVTTTADSGPGSLRQAILDSDATSGGTNTISFSIPGEGIQTISPISPLPAITNPVILDGFSQPGYTGTPLIDLNGSQEGVSGGLEITGSGSTIRGLDITEFYQGAGILITGVGATQNTLEANVIGTDPTGALALPNEYGVQISAGASNNEIGGETAALGNLIAFNVGPGIDVLDDGSVGNRVSANRLYSSNDLSSLHFDGNSIVSLPNALIGASAQSQTLEAMFQTSSGGVIIGYQSMSAGIDAYPAAYVPALYVGTDGMLYGGSFDATDDSPEMVASSVAVNDDRWHSVALVSDAQAATITLYLDGQVVGSVSATLTSINFAYDQIGSGFSNYAPATPFGWYGFVGQIAGVRVWSGARSPDQISQDMQTAPAVRGAGTGGRLSI